jgi:mycofactocin precursor
MGESEGARMDDDVVDEQGAEPGDPTQPDELLVEEISIDGLCGVY